MSLNRLRVLRPGRQVRRCRTSLLVIVTFPDGTAVSFASPYSQNVDEFATYVLARFRLGDATAVSLANVPSRKPRVLLEFHF